MSTSRSSTSKKAAEAKEEQINWKDKIDSCYIVLNEEACSRAGIDLASSSEEEIEEFKKNESLVLVKLGGFKQLARARGFSEIQTELLKKDEKEAIIKCTITFVPNEENKEGLKVSAIANASIYNVAEDFAIYMEAIAENRAFVRAVKNALSITLLGQDEIPQNKVKVSDNSPSLHSALKKAMEERGLSFDALKDNAVKKNYAGAENWNSLQDIPLNSVMKILNKLKPKE